MSDETRPGVHHTPRARGASDRIPTVGSSTFDALVLQGEGPIAVEFMSYGCAHCRAIEPILQQVAEMAPPRAKIFRVNIAADPDLADRYEVGGTPTLVMFRDGAEVGRVEGPSPTLAGVLAAVTEPFGS
jgi:thioredoxin 1